MKKIIKHGNTFKYKTECYECGCVFTYESVDICRGEKYNLTKYVSCPDCGREILHDEVKILTNEEYETTD